MARGRAGGKRVEGATRRSLLSFMLAAMSLVTGPTALAQNLDVTPFPIKLPPKDRPRIEKKETTMEDLFQRTEFPLANLPPISLDGTNIPGLLPKTVHTLGLYQFVVVNNTSFTNMSELYKDNRLKGKANFVTADCIVHPYLGYTNALHAAVIEEQLIPRTMSMLAAMLKTAAADYKSAEDADVREDVEKNLAFISLALRLLDPTLKVPALGNGTKLADTELKLVLDGRQAHSVIFDRDEDYGAYVPQGWYASNEQLKNYYRCQQWLTRAYFPLNDTSKNAGGNSFRRSVLLYRSLDQATVNNAPAMNVWNSIYQLSNLLGAPSSADHVLLPLQYKSTLRGTQDFKLTLNSLSEPFYRAKLLLSVRRQKPVEIGSASIFDLKKAKETTENEVIFRFLPPVEDPELQWMRDRAHSYSPEGSEGPDCPLALLDLHCHGAGQATNILAESIWHLDPTLTQVLPDLVQSVGRKLPAVTPAVAVSNSYSLTESRWQILSTYFRAMPDSVQPVMRTSQWLTRRLESAFGGWVDGQLSICRPSGDDKVATPDDAPLLSTPTAAPVKPANFQYLEPCPELYRKIGADIGALTAQLTSLNAFPQRFKGRGDDFIRLCQRLETIAQRETNNQAMLPVDMRLLGNIDIVLAKISAPLGGTIFLDNGSAAKAQGHGCNLAIGRPGFLYLIMQTTKGPTLVRGAIYTYYEIPGGPIKAEHFNRKLEYGLLRPPSWASEFDVVQDSPIKARND